MQEMKADKNLERDINKAQTYEDLMGLLHNSLERSNIAFRDPETGQFVRRDPLTPAAQTITPEEEPVTKTETIGGKEFTFTGTPLEVERQIGDAYRIAEEVQATTPPLPAPPIQPTQAQREQQLFDRTQLELKLRRGEIDAATFLEQSGAIDEYLASKGFDVEAAASKQHEAAWAQAVEAFFDTSEGQTWRGGERNLAIAGNWIAAHGLIEAPDKVAVLRAMAADLRAQGLEFDSDVSEQQILDLAQTAKSPQELLEAFKDAHSGDPEAANQAFIEAFRGGRQSSGLFGQ